MICEKMVKNKKEAALTLQKKAKSKVQIVTKLLLNISVARSERYFSCEYNRQSFVAAERNIKREGALDKIS